ncbi:MAG: hypothetical protein WCJ56_03895 [bacterium]
MKVHRLAKNLGIGITLHGLRHSHATTLIAAGVCPSTRKRVAGAFRDINHHEYLRPLLACHAAAGC